MSALPAFERTLRTLADLFEDDDDAADEEVLFLLRTAYKLSGEAKLFEHPEVLDLRDFCLRWYRLLDVGAGAGERQGELSKVELEIVYAWSRRIGSMGSSAVKRTGWYGFRANARKNNPKAGDAWTGVLNGLREQCETLAHLETQTGTSQLTLCFRLPWATDQRLIAFSCEPELGLLVNVGQRQTKQWGVPDVAQAGAILRASLQELGMKNSNFGDLGRFKAEFGPGHTRSRAEGFSTALLAFADEVERIIQRATAARAVAQAQAHVVTPPPEPPAPESVAQVSREAGPTPPRDPA